MITQNITVEVVGPPDILSELTSSDISADVNLLNANISENQFSYDISFSCPKYDNVWVATSYKVAIQRTEKQPETTASTQTTISNEYNSTTSAN